MSMRPRAKAEDGRRQRTPYQWVIEGDIKGCFDNIDHHRLMERVRARVTDGKVTRLIAQFLKAGVLSDGFLLPTDKGTPQGGVISPLLANIALGVIEERYERWVHHRRKIQARRKSDAMTAAVWARMTDRKAGRAVFFPIRYADDFVVLVSGTREQAEQEKAELAKYLHETMGLELSIEKTQVVDLTEGFQFLGHRVRYKWHPRFGYMPRTRNPNQQTGGSSVHGEADDRPHQRSGHWLTFSRNSIRSCGDGGTTIASAPAQAVSSRLSTSMSEIASGAG